MWPYAFEGLYQHNRSGTLDSSSGYESANNDTSIVETYAVTHARSEHYRCTKRRMLSCTQREEANRRERHRMEIINQAYEDLRNVLPSKKGRKRLKMSRMDTVDGAIQYIHALLETLQAVGDAAENQLMPNPENGEDFHQRIVEYFIELCKNKTGKDIRKDYRAVQKLRHEVKKVKRTLSSQHQVKIEIESFR
ncbi:unnamed protein product [Rotaria socialis]|uniref:BHLH domain-containing protein n=1 Tax=Rotaria socialis TaxID=392032 RepID=A0A819AM53_9BILA|nr:unnamed protein product [Rotaria socialis]